MVWNKIITGITAAMGGADAANAMNVKQDIHFLFFTFENSSWSDVWLMLLMVAVAGIVFINVWGAVWELIKGIIRFLFFVVGIPVAIYGFGVSAFGEQDAMLPVMGIIIVYWIILAMSSGKPRHRPREEPDEEHESRPARRRRHNAA